MLHMSAVSESPLLSSDERPAAEVFNPRGTASAVLVCEHASRVIPAALSGLGLDAEAARSHAAWDIGALALAQRLALSLRAPLVASRISRLVYDCNRPPSAADAVPAKSERFTIPGNANLSPTQRKARVHEVYDPFRRLLADTIAARPTPPVIITIHSFTPVYNGQHRAVELGVLHDADGRAARWLLPQLQHETPLRCEMNAPYSATDGVTHTLREHALPQGLPNVMIEVRNDLLDTDADADRIAGLLAPVFSRMIGRFGQPAEGDAIQMIQKTGKS